MASLTLHHVSKHYGSGASATPVIHQLSAAIEDGEFVVIVGPSGCGKSTLLRMVAGLEGASSGDIHIGAQRVNDLEPSARDIAMVFQNYALYPHMTVFDNMAYGLKLAKLPAATINTRVRHVADILELGPLLQRKPQALSGGQRQRVAMGRAIVRQPQLFLFDEPLSNLDTQLRGHTRLEIQKLHRELGTTSLYVTHDQVEAMTLAQRVLVLNQGKVEQFDTPQAVYARPASTFVARFMGASPMNLLRHAPHTPAGLTLGVRPEHLDISPSGWPLTAYAIETLGAERLIYAHWTHILQDNTKRTTPSETLILRTDEATPTPALGSPFYATPRPDRLHYFDTATGLRKDPAAHPL